MIEDNRRIAVIGAGRVGTALAVALAARGYEVVMICDPDRAASGRAADLTGASSTDDPVEAARVAGVVFMTVPDDSIMGVCETIAGSGIDIEGKKFVHASGALSLEALGPVKERGARTAAVHPIQTFADLEGALDSLPGSTFGVTCPPDLEEWAMALVENLGGRAIMIDEEDRVLYHAAAVVASNLMVMIEHCAMKLYMGLGMTERDAVEAYLPLVRATVDNMERIGPVRALTGPLARGDAGTVGAHVQVLGELDPELAELYRAVSRWGLRIVLDRGEVEEEKIIKLRRLLEP